MTPSVRMKTRQQQAAFTLVEFLVSSGIISVVGGLVFVMMLAGLQLFGKNVAANVPFQGSRVAYDLLQRDLHSSLADLTLFDASFNPVTGSGPAAGVAMRWLTAGPCLVAVDATAPATTIEVQQSGGAAPHVGDLLSLPAFRIERTVTSVSSSGSNWLIGIDAALGSPLTNAATQNFLCLFTRRCGYSVAGGALVRYADLGNPANSRVVTRGVANATPFSFPLVGSQPDRRFLVTQLTAVDPGSSNRGWRAVGANLNFTIAVRATSPVTTQ